MAAFPDPPPSIPAVRTAIGDGWEEIRKRAPGDTGRRLALLILEHLGDMRAGEVAVLLKFDARGQWWSTRILPAAIECGRLRLGGAIDDAR